MRLSVRLLSVSPVLVSSGAGTNLQVGSHVRKKFCRVPPLFFGSESTISCFGERFPGGQYGLVNFVCAVLFRVPPRDQPFVNVGARALVPYGVGATACIPLLFRSYEMILPF